MKTYVCRNPDGTISKLYNNIENIFKNIVENDIPNGDYIIYKDNNNYYIYVIILEYPRNTINECYNFIEDKLLKNIETLNKKDIKNKFIKFLEEEILDSIAIVYKVYINYVEDKYKMMYYKQIGE